MTPVHLLASYDEVVATLAREIDATSAPSARIVLNFYIIEPGDSTQQILAAAKRAASRGVPVQISLDDTWASRLSRFWEKTTSVLPELVALAAEVPNIVVTRRRVTDHSKYAIFDRAGATSTAIIGGMNLGDRFRTWRDFALRVDGPPLVNALAAAAQGERSQAQPGSVAFVANVPTAGVFDVLPAFERLARDPRLVRFRVAAAYVDARGAAILGRALDRGAALELILPRRANVYQHANMRALVSLLRKGVRAHLVPGMLHAKALLAWSDTGARTAAFLGSANLKRNSLVAHGEMNALVTDEAFTLALERALDALVADGEPVSTALPYNLLYASAEELFG
jgi:phosphatidylserine/phosphatidylglycerophosphate/cardiolipin synthase-like enzyme